MLRVVIIECTDDGNPFHRINIGFDASLSSALMMGW
jgi:hypothetical protein